MNRWVFPPDRLPPGFLASLDTPPHPPAQPRPSSTLVLLREGRPNPDGEPSQNEGSGLEVLLLKRSPRSGFIPSAWVFPGGTVDEEDEDPRLLPRLHGISPESAKARLQVKGAWPTSTAYWVAALRETFEETGVLLQRGGQGRRGEFAAEKEAHGQSEAERSARAALLAGSKSFAQVLEMLDAELDAGSLEYTGHWLTPECEPRRYETRFFSAEVSRAAQVTTHEKEMVDSVWITPAEALARNAGGTFPLVLPTVFTLEELAPFPTPREALAHMRTRPVPLRLPRPERVEGGVLFRLTEPADLPEL